MKNDTFLLLERDPKAALLFQKQFEKHGYTLVLASSAIEAQQKLTSDSPSLFIVDLFGLEEGAFLAFLRDLRLDNRREILPIILIESKKNRQLTETLQKEFDGNHFLQRPIKLGTLLEKVEYFLKVRDDESNEFNNLSTLLHKQIGSTVIERELGRGGMGIVFLGYQKSLDRYVAVKTLLPQMLREASTINRFKTEALAIAKVRSPHIVQVYDAGLTEEKIFYIIMEYLDGDTLSQILSKRGKCSIEESIEVLKQVATGLLVAHKMGLVHRDIKPSNLIINSEGHVSITDFGLVRFEGDHGQTKTGMILGTPHYLSPEQVTGKVVDSRSDIYSLGIVLYEMLVGHPPFSAESSVSVLMKHLQEPFPDPRAEIPDIPLHLVNVLFTMTQKERNSRYSSCTELLAAIETLGPRKRISGISTADDSNSTMSVLIEPEKQLDTLFLHKLQSLKKSNPLIFTEEYLEGWGLVSDSGSLNTLKGNIPAFWKEAAYLMQGVIGQIMSVYTAGKWVQICLHSNKQRLILFPRGAETGTFLFRAAKAPNFSDMPMETGKADDMAAGTTKTSALQQLFAVSGVQAILVMDPAGEIIDFRSNTDLPRDKLALRFNPLPEILRSLPHEIVEIDCFFESGRALLSLHQDHLIIILGDKKLNVPLLALLKNKLSTNLLSLVDSREITDITFKEKTPVANPVDAQLLADIRGLFLSYIGPIAPIAMKKLAKKMGYSLKAFPEKKLELFITTLAQNLDDVKSKKFFEEAMDIVFLNKKGKKE